MKSIKYELKKVLMKKFISVDCKKIENAERLGSSLAGWYTPLNILNADSVCYCIGAGEDISFDCSLISKFNCPVFIFDPTPRAIDHIEELIEKTNSGLKMYTINDEMVIDGKELKEPYTISKEEISKLNHQKIGIWNEDTNLKFFLPQKEEKVSASVTNIQKTQNFFEAECLTLSSVMKRLGHKSIDLLKMDIEGAEYAVIDSMIESNIRPKILGLEFHFEDSNPFFSEVKKLKRSIKSIINLGMVPIYQEKFDMVFLRNDCI